MSFDALATTLGWPPVATITCSALVFSAGGQLALLTALSAGSGVALALGAATLISLRFLAMGIAVSGSLEGPGLETGAGRTDHRRRILGSGLSGPGPVWVLGTVVGVVAAPDPSLVETWGLGALVVLIGRNRRPSDSTDAVLGERWREFDWTLLPGLAVIGVLWLFGRSQFVCIVAGVLVCVAIRALL